jgi:hypothetical protein
LPGHPQANLNISASETPPTPAFSVIDSIYLEGGLYVIGGMKGRVNQQEQPMTSGVTWDSPSILNWVAERFVAFHNTEDHRAWLVDGASALLHLVRISLHRDETNPESNYDWVFKKEELKEDWIGLSGRTAARRTLKDWENRALPVYVKDCSFIRGHPVKTYSTFGNRVDQMLDSLDLVIDRQIHIAKQGGIKIPQTTNFRKSIVGIDIIDLISPRSKFVSRVEYFNSGHKGWIDLLPAIGVLTIFGKGFGDLIRPSEPDTACVAWRSVPTGENYLACSVSTLLLLHKEKAEKPGRKLETGELTDKLDWMSPCKPFDSCQCIKGKQVGRLEHHDPVQYIVSKSWYADLKLKPSTPVDIFSLATTGAVVFVNLSSLGRRIDPQNVEVADQTSRQLGVASASNSGNDSLTPSASQSTTAQSSSSTNPTETSLQGAGAAIGQDQSQRREDRSISAKLKGKMKAKLQTWYPSQRRPKT